MMKVKGVESDDSENEFEVYDPKEYDRTTTDTFKSSSKRRNPTRVASSTKKKPQVLEDEDKKEKILHKKKRSKNPSKNPTRDQGTVAKIKSKKKPEKVEQFVNEDDIKLDSEESDEDLDKETLINGLFFICKTDMIGNGDPPIWKLDCKELIQKYISFKCRDKVLYKNTNMYSAWGNSFKDKYCSVPISYIRKIKHLRIIEFYKDKFKNDLKVEDSVKKKLEVEEFLLESDEEEQY